MNIPFEAIFEQSPNAYMLLDRELRFVAANSSYLAATGTRLDDLIGRKITEVFPHDETNPNNQASRRLEESLRSVFVTGQRHVLALIPYRIPVTHGGVTRQEEFFWSATHTPIRGSDGQVEFVLQHTVNVTELQATLTDAQSAAGVIERAAKVEASNAALGATLAEFRAVFAQAPGFMCFVRGPDHVFEIANHAYDQLVGHRSILGRPLREALPETVDQGFAALLDEVYRTGKAYVGHGVLVKLQRTPGAALDDRFVDFVYQPIFDGDGACVGIFVQGSDITQQKLAESERERSLQAASNARAELEAIFASFPEALYVTDGSRIRRANSAALSLLGLATVEDVQQDFARVLTATKARDSQTAQPLDPRESPAARAARGESVRTEVIIHHGALDEDRVVQSSAAPIRHGDRIVGAVVTHIDITARHRAEEELRKFAKVLDATRDVVFIVDLSLRAIFLNEAGRRLLEVADVDRSLDRTLLGAVADRERDRVRDIVIPTALRDGYWEGELLARTQATGAEIPVLVSVFPLRDASGHATALAAIARDLRMQKVADAERARLLDNERRSRAQAEEASRLKDEFLATVSHELRTPLTSMLGWVRMLRSGMLSIEKREAALETVERNARAQAQLIDDLLDVSRIVSGKLALEIEPTDVASVVGAAVETVRPSADAKNIRLLVSMAASELVLGDSHRLVQVMLNLLSNAVKFTPSGGAVTVNVARRGAFVEISVQDSGQGIDAAFLPHVFERFRQADGGTTRRLGGLGLGLSIVRHIVESHGGEVEAQSAGEGQGSTFIVRLPLHGSPAERDEATRTGVDAQTGGSLAGMRVLVVDDEDDTRAFVRALLEQHHAQVTDVANAADALAALKREHPDVLVSDIGMPEQDGYQLIAAVRALDAADGGRTPAVALTAYARPTDRKRALVAGFQHYVTKPVEPSELIAVVAALRTSR